ncbi:MAG TPA: 4-hydroxy-tetrahydrodipicolinate synthase [Steroidobacteraceae bacterium]|jgi:4-hydroxy-tetrahydrodipicolinate synthase
MFSGSLVPIATPMRPDGSLDFAAWAKLLDFHAANGTSGVVVGGTSGESATLTDAEMLELTERACAHLGQRIPVIAGAGSSSTAATVARVQRLSQLPIAALLVVTPAYNRPPQEGLYRHYAAVAEATRVPVIAYNVPARTAVDMLPATVARLAKLSAIMGIKEAVPQIARVRELLDSCGPDFVVLSGDDATAREAMLCGARGVISVTANVAPRAMAQMAAAAVSGDRVGAEERDAPLRGLHRDLFIEANPIPTKWVLARMGLIGPGIRLPLTELASTYHAAVTASARAAGVAF